MDKPPTPPEKTFAEWVADTPWAFLVFSWLSLLGIQAFMMINYYLGIQFWTVKVETTGQWLGVGFSLFVATFLIGPVSLFLLREGR